MRFLKRALQALEDTLEANLPTALRAVETEDGLTANSLTDPVDYVRAPIPNDTRSPLIQIWEVGWQWIDQRNQNVVIDVTMAVSYAGGAQDVEANLDFGRRYIQAMCDVVYDDPALGNEVNVAIISDGDPLAEPSKSATRYTFAQGLQIQMLQNVRTNP